MRTGRLSHKHAKVKSGMWKSVSHTVSRCPLGMPENMKTAPGRDDYSIKTAFNEGKKQKLIPHSTRIVPMRKLLQQSSKINIVFVYGKDDWMDKMGDYRLNKYDPDKYKIFSTYGGHSFALENPKELSLIISQYFDC